MNKKVKKKITIYALSTQWFFVFSFFESAKNMCFSKKKIGRTAGEVLIWKSIYWCYNTPLRLYSGKTFFWWVFPLHYFYATWEHGLSRAGSTVVDGPDVRGLIRDIERIREFKETETRDFHLLSIFEMRKSRGAEKILCWIQERKKETLLLCFSFLGSAQE